MNLFIQSYLSGNYANFEFELKIVVIIWLMVAFAIAIDLLSGLSKAKERGEVHTSYGFRRTVSKAVLYYALMLFALMFDAIGMFIYPLPYITLVAAAFLIFIECKSILEKAHEKDRRILSKNLEDFIDILNDKDVIKNLGEMLKKQMNKEKEEETVDETDEED
ncbi:MAG: phage holin family protein [Dysgonomonas sp.]|nr:phage holin family protein [Dysgonomonas sp.]